MTDERRGPRGQEAPRALLPRREFLKRSARFARKSALGAAALPFLGRALCDEGHKDERPNILFAIADDWGWPHSPLYGDRVVATPTFASIAARGALFRNAFVSASSCTPSRNAILTGQHHWRLGSGASLHSSLPVEHATFPNLLEDAGYFTGSFRKAYGPGRDGPRRAAGRRFKSVEAFLAERPEGAPFCFWFGSSDPHRGYRAGSGIASGMKPEDVQVPPCLPDCEAVRSDICDYYFEVQRFDREVGEALRLFEKAGALENTIVVMTGDHGWPFPRGKANLYDLGTHVPLAVQWGDRIGAGRVVDDFVSFTDFAPTFLEAAGLPVLSAMTGRSLIDVLRAPGSGRIDPERDHVVTGKERHTPAQPEGMGGTPMRALRTEEFLYIRNFEPDRWPAGGPTSVRGPAYSDIDGGPTKEALLRGRDTPAGERLFALSCGKRPAEELYDLRKDPHQLADVAALPEYAQDLKAARDRLTARLKETGDPRVAGGEVLFDSYPYYGRIEKNGRTEKK